MHSICIHLYLIQNPIYSRIGSEVIDTCEGRRLVNLLCSTRCYCHSQVYVCCNLCRREVVYQARGKQLCGGALATPGASATPPYVLRHILRGQKWPEGDMAFHRRITVPVLLLHGLRDENVALVHMCEMEKVRQLHAG